MNFPGSRQLMCRRHTRVPLLHWHAGWAGARLCRGWQQVFSGKDISIWGFAYVWFLIVSRHQLSLKVLAQAFSENLSPSETLADAPSVHQHLRWGGTIIPGTPSNSKILFVPVAFTLQLWKLALLRAKNFHFAYFSLQNHLTFVLSSFLHLLILESSALVDSLA